MEALLLNLAWQVPLLVLFVVYNERMLDRFDKVQAQRDSERDKSQAVRDKLFSDGLDKIVSALEKLRDRLDE